MKFCRSLEGPGKVASPHVPQTGPLWRELPVSTAFFYMPLEFVNKSFPINEISPFSRRAWERSVPPCSPNGAPVERVACFHSLLLHVSRIPQ